jgi:hypothetical protein
VSALAVAAWVALSALVLAPIAYLRYEMPRRRVWLRELIEGTPLPDPHPTGPRSQAIPPHTHLHTHPTSGPPSLAEAAEVVLTALGPDNARRAVRALAPIAHPDAGGRAEVMAELTAARDRLTDSAQGGRADR